MWKHDAQVQMISSDISKAAKRPIGELRPTRIRRLRLYIKALGTHFGSNLWNLTISHPLSAGRMAANRELNPIAVLHAWGAKVAGFRPYLQEAGPRKRLYREPISTLVGWHCKAHRAVLSLVATIASR